MVSGGRRSGPFSRPRGARSFAELWCAGDSSRSGWRFSHKVWLDMRPPGLGCMPSAMFRRRNARHPVKIERHERRRAISPDLENLAELGGVGGAEIRRRFHAVSSTSMPRACARVMISSGYASFGHRQPAQAIVRAELDDQNLTSPSSDQSRRLSPPADVSPDTPALTTSYG